MVTYMLPIVLREYLDEAGRSPFRLWRAALDVVARERVTRALTRLAMGNTSNVKGVGQGVSELKINFGPGYRVYFGWDGRALVILLGGGTKQRQERDIETARRHWVNYGRRKQGG